MAHPQHLQVQLAAINWQKFNGSHFGIGEVIIGMVSVNCAHALYFKNFATRYTDN
jgi:hypothetical protein